MRRCSRSQITRSRSKSFRLEFARRTTNGSFGLPFESSTRLPFPRRIVAQLNNSFVRPNFASSMSEVGTVPDKRGHFGPYGGMFVPETLMSALHDLATEYESAKKDPAFQNELSNLLRDFAGRPTPLYFAERLSNRLK